ncbi:MAG: hypothetical protein ACYCW6_20660 [Candidatus Xenobia bacterium]
MTCRTWSTPVSGPRWLPITAICAVSLLLLLLRPARASAEDITLTVENARHTLHVIRDAHGHRFVAVSDLHDVGVTVEESQDAVAVSIPGRPPHEVVYHAYTPQKALSFNLDQADLRDLLWILGREMGVNVAALGVEQSPVTLHCSHEPAKQILEDVVPKAGLAYRLIPGFLLVGPPDRIKSFPTDVMQQAAVPQSPLQSAPDGRTFLDVSVLMALYPEPSQPRSPDAPLNFDLTRASLSEVLPILADEMGRLLAVGEPPQRFVSVRLSRVPAQAVLRLVAAITRTSYQIDDSLLTTPDGAPEGVVTGAPDEVTQVGELGVKVGDVERDGDVCHVPITLHNGTDHDVPAASSRLAFSWLALSTGQSVDVTSWADRDARIASGADLQTVIDYRIPGGEPRWLLLHRSVHETGPAYRFPLAPASKSLGFSDASRLASRHRDRGASRRPSPGPNADRTPADDR